MVTADRPAVERRRPPKGAFVVVNRVMRWLLASPRRASGLGRHVLLLHVTGRTSGRRIDVPVGYRELPDGRLLVFTNSIWRANLRGRPQVELTRRGVRRPASAELVEDPDAVADVYRAAIAEVGHTRAGRRLGLRINVDREPTHEELADVAERSGLALIYLTPDPG